MEKLTSGEKSALYKQKVSLNFNNMGYLDNKEVTITLKNKKTGMNEEFTRKARYTSGINTIDIYYNKGYGKKLIFINGVLTTGRRDWNVI